MRIAVLVCVFALGLRGEDLRTAAQDPVGLARFVASHFGFDWGPLYEAWGLKDVERLRCARPGCTAELIRVLHPDQTIVLISSPDATVDLYVRYRDGKFAGVYGAYVRNYPRRHSVIRVAGRPFLRVSEQGVTGSGVGSEVERWFDLTEWAFSPVFGFTVQGHDSRLRGIARRLFGHASVSGNTISVRTEVLFSASTGGDLGRAEWTTVYAWEGGEFRSRVGVDADELLDVDEGPSDEVLMRYCMKGLREIAKGRAGETRDWLLRLVAGAQDTAEVRELRGLLRKP